MRVEIRAANDAVIEGYVNAVGRDSRILTDIKHGKFIEQVKPGTFARALTAANDVILKLNHRRQLGKRSTGDVELYEDSIGLYARAHITDEEVIESARKKELKGWSFTFSKPKDRWEPVNDTLQRRNLEGFDLLEVSILTITPAYIATSIEMRGEDAGIIEERCIDDERIELREELSQPDGADGKKTEDELKKQKEKEKEKRELLRMQLEIMEMEDFSNE